MYCPVFPTSACGFVAAVVVVIGQNSFAFVTKMGRAVMQLVEAVA